MVRGFDSCCSGDKNHMMGMTQQQLFPTFGGFVAYLDHVLLPRTHHIWLAGKQSHTQSLFSWQTINQCQHESGINQKFPFCHNKVDRPTHIVECGSENWLPCDVCHVLLSRYLSADINNHLCTFPNVELITELFIHVVWTSKLDSKQNSDLLSYKCPILYGPHFTSADGHSLSLSYERL